MSGWAESQICLLLRDTWAGEETSVCGDVRARSRNTATMEEGCKVNMASNASFYAFK